MGNPHFWWDPLVRAASHFLARAAIAAIAVVLVVVLVSTTSGKPVPAAQTFYPPSSINDTCATDDTVALGAWLYSLPKGISGSPTQVNFGTGCYQIDGTLFLRGFQYFTFENGKFVQKVANDVATGDWSGVGPVRPAYCGNPKYTTDITDLYTLDPFTLMWAFEGGCDITLQNMKISGPNTAATSGNYHLEQDTFINFYGTQRALVSNVIMRNPYGDYVDAVFLHESSGGVQYLVPATDITVQNCNLAGSGRQGLSVILANRVAFVNNTIYSAHATVFDVEQDAIGGLETDILISGNALVGFHYADVLSAQTGGKIERLQFTNNNMIDGGQMRVIIADKLLGSDVRIDNNTASAVDSASDYVVPAIQMLGILPRTVEIDDNTIPLGPGGLTNAYRTSLVCMAAACPAPSPIAPPIPPALP